MILGRPLTTDRNQESGGQNWKAITKSHNKMTPFVLVRLATAAVLLAAASGSAPAQAQKPWKHGIIAPKADAGFLLMAAKRGFAEKEGLKLELLEVKDDQIGLKALLSGELDSYEGGVQGGIAAELGGADAHMIGGPR